MHKNDHNESRFVDMNCGYTAPALRAQVRRMKRKPTAGKVTVVTVATNAPKQDKDQRMSAALVENAAGEWVAEFPTRTATIVEKG